MKIVSIDLSDVRRFSHSVRIAGFGPGLNLLAAPNEQGKSTVFDALQALFFQPYRTKSKEIRALRPHVGGAPSVAVEIDLPDGRYRIAKRWLSREEVTVHRDGRLVAKADEAESFIAGLIRPEEDGGPAGLLWVRQGLTQLEDAADTQRLRDGARAARRELIGSVAGEIEAVTGGRRMDRALERARAELGRYLTATGRPLKGGPLQEAEQQVEALSRRRDEFAAIAARLDAALARRRELRRDLDLLSDPEATATRQARLQDAQVRHDAAQRHAQALAAAEAEVRSAALAVSVTADRLAVLRQAVAERDQAVRAARNAAEAAALAQSRLQAAEQVLQPAQAALDEARGARQLAEDRLRASLEAEAGRIAQGRRVELGQRLEQARALAAHRAALVQAAASGPDARAMAALETLVQEVGVQRGLRDRGAPRLRMHHAGPSRVLLDGQPLADDQPVAVLVETTLDLPGLGRLTVTPGWGQEDGALGRAEAELAAALARLGLTDPVAARQAAAARTEAQAALRDLDGQMKALAPEGIVALETELAALPAAVAAGTDLPSPEAARAAAAAARDRLAAAEAAQEAARGAVELRRHEEARARVMAETAAEAAARAAAALDRLGDPASEEPMLLDRLAAQEAAREAARRGHDALAATAPDLAAVTAALARARSVVEAAEADLRRLGIERAGLDSEILLRSGEGVMEDLADCEARLVAARDGLERLQFEVAVLKELQAVLEAARDEARDRYLEPVKAELRPLLRALWPDAELRFDGESLLPTELVRAGQAEALAILSGGTQEQVALMVRLAFARLLARRGRPAPVILDDALIFTDDDRIETMFDALTGVAADQQILVLSCRQRAFRDLGGTRLTIEPVAEA